MASSNFLLVSLPQNAAPNGGDPEVQLESWYAENLKLASSDISHFEIPIFKIGTLDSLVQQSEELTKIDGQFHGILGKVHDIMETVFESTPAKMTLATKVQGSKWSQYTEIYKVANMFHRGSQGFRSAFSMVNH